MTDHRRSQAGNKHHLGASMRGLSANLRASLGASSPLGDSLTKGELREEVIRAAFRPHIAARYELVKGIVVNSVGKESDPQDLILVDSNILPTVLGFGTTRAVPVEGVVGTIQIKSLATPSSITHAIRNVASSKRMVPAIERFGVYGPTKTGWAATSSTFFGGVLFLDKRGKPERLLDAFAEEVMKLPPRERCDALCIVDEFAVIWGDPSKGDLHLSYRAEQAEAPMAFYAKGNSLLFFYLSLAEHLRNWVTPPFSWFDYVFGADGASPGFSFSWSPWYDEDDPPDWVARWDSKRPT
jgi:hypothetical protein